MTTSRRKSKRVTYAQNIRSFLFEQQKDYTLSKLIEEGESYVLEFKSSMVAIMKEDLGIKRLEDMHKNAEKYEKKFLENSIRIKERIIRDKLENSIVKTISSFLNSEGGFLLVGVEDDGTICGIEKDYPLLNKNRYNNWECWLEHLLNLIKEKIGVEFVSHLNVKRICMQDKTIAKIIVKKSGVPVFVGKKITKFYIRHLDTCRSLRADQMDNYIVNHWSLK
jgi:predicted HTH transcriptional regulator